MKLIEVYDVDEDGNELWTTDQDYDFVTHPEHKCKGQTCAIHNPSDHAMRTWSMHWRSDRGLMERICPEHHTGHPDPDDIAFYAKTHTKEEVWARGIHGCCMCELGGL